MPLDERDAAHFWDMLSAAREVRGIVRGVTRNAFLDDRIRIRALERALELVGEAARRVSAPGQLAHPEIPWRAVIGQRNLLAHEYGRIDHAILYETARKDIPALVKALDKIVRALPKP
jgi:uncharacterized protein with HEPN domain